MSQLLKMLDAKAVRAKAHAVGENVALQRRAVAVAKDSGLIGGTSPREILTIVRNMRVLGALGAGVVNAATKYPNRLAMIDEQGSITYAELDRATNAVANAWLARGFKSGGRIAILARNHRGFLIALFAAGKVGARIVLLNTDFAGPQIREVVAREGLDILIYDTEYEQFLDGVSAPLGTWVAWTDEPREDSLSRLAQGDTGRPPAPGTHAKLVVLTSGTTGTPKGAPRSEPRSLVPVTALLERAPFRSGSVVEMCAPMFHSLGLGFTLLMIALGNTLVVRRRFSPEATLDSIVENRSTGMVAVPVMLARMVDLGEEAFATRDLSSLNCILAGGSQLGGELATRVIGAFGPVLRNLYGSTEVAYASIATPEDLIAEPTCVGKICMGTVVKILDDTGKEVPNGVTGRIFVRNAIPFDGYTGGGNKEVIDGLMSTGDVGHFDSAGRLFVDGRDDEMIVSGGENVFPREVEELLMGHPAVNDAACVGADDATFGQRLRAFVVLEPGEELDTDGVQAYVRENLARYKVPRDVVFLEELPRNATGKILKRVLKEL